MLVLNNKLKDFWTLLIDFVQFNDIIKCILHLLQAKDMVTLSKTISMKIKDKQGDITEDEVLSKDVWSPKSTTLNIYFRLFELEFQTLYLYPCSHSHQLDPSNLFYCSKRLLIIRKII